MTTQELRALEMYDTIVEYHDNNGCEPEFQYLVEVTGRSADTVRRYLKILRSFSEEDIGNLRKEWQSVMDNKANLEPSIYSFMQETYRLTLHYPTIRQIATKFKISRTHASQVVNRIKANEDLDTKGFRGSISDAEVSFVYGTLLNLYFVSHHSPSYDELAELSEVSKKHISRIIKKLVQMGLVEHSDNKHRSIVLLHTDGAGKACFTGYHSLKLLIEDMDCRNVSFFMRKYFGENLKAPIIAQISKALNISQARVKTAQVKLRSAAKM